MPTGKKTSRVTRVGGLLEGLREGAEGLGGAGKLAVRWAKETRWSGREIGKRIFGSGGYRQWVLEKEGGEALVRAGIEKVAELVRGVRKIGRGVQI